MIMTMICHLPSGEKGEIFLSKVDFLFTAKYFIYWHLSNNTKLIAMFNLPSHTLKLAANSSLTSSYSTQQNACLKYPHALHLINLFPPCSFFSCKCQIGKQHVKL